MAPFPQSYLDCVVALGVETEAGRPDWVGSGFLYGYPARRAPSDPPQHEGYHVYLVTNRHVFDGLSSVVLRFNPRARAKAREYQIDLVKNGTPLWFPHPRDSVDIAVVPIDFALLKRQALQVSFFAQDVHAFGVTRLRDAGVGEGDDAFVLGFPMGLVGGRRNFVIVRGGTVARIQDALARAKREFLIDAFVFPGNSGGPVLVRLPATAGGNCVLGGIVRSYLSYQDVAVSTQTQRPRIIFEENSGLAAAIPVDFIRQTIRHHLQMLRRRHRSRSGVSAAAERAARRG
jgi:S1-C subfamily serine protease